EGRDLDFIFPGTWPATMTGCADVTLSEGLYRGYHHYMTSSTSADTDRLKGCLQVPGSDPEWTVAEIKKWANEKWVAAVWVHLKEGLPVD
ncbi:hypothetical protein L9G16_20880, partial [Shewanella sp. A25]|nr:hypothetical protein [Shewanella shenzhenensis]